MMKRFLIFIIPLFVVISLSAAQLRAGDNDCDTTYENFKKAYMAGSLKDLERALELAKNYLADKRCYDDASSDIQPYLRIAVVKIEHRIRQLRAGHPDNFDEAISYRNWERAFELGKQMIAENPDDSLDTAIVLASVGLERVQNPTEPTDRYNRDTIAMAKWVIEHIDNKSVTYGKGVFRHYKIPAFPDGKSNALGHMNYIIGKITYDRLNDRTGALPYLYKAATQTNSSTTLDSSIYERISEWYMDRIKPRGGRHKERFSETEKRYLDLALDAYLRACRLLPSGGLTFLGVDPVAVRRAHARARIIYEMRFGSGNKDGFHEYLQSKPVEPFPDPMKVNQ